MVGVEQLWIYASRTLRSCHWFGKLQTEFHTWRLFRKIWNQPLRICRFWYLGGRPYRQKWAGWSCWSGTAVTSLFKHKGLAPNSKFTTLHIRRGRLFCTWISTLFRANGRQSETRPNSMPGSRFHLPGWAFCLRPWSFGFIFDIPGQHHKTHPNDLVWRSMLSAIGNIKQPD